jgi:hypothetical protein
MPITRAQLLTFMRMHRYAVQASVHPAGAPQGAVVGVAISDQFEVVFDTLGTSRKACNLRRSPAIALVFGGSESNPEGAVQLEGFADEPLAAERDRLVNLYLGVFPDGRDRQNLPDLTYFRVKPRWIRYSDFGVTPPELVEFAPASLGELE